MLLRGLQGVGIVLLLDIAAITADWGPSSPLSLHCHRAGVGLCCLLGGCNLGSSVPGSAPGTFLPFTSLVMPGRMQRAGKYQQCLQGFHGWACGLYGWTLWLDLMTLWLM